MTDFKNKIDSELKTFQFECDINEIERKFKRKKKIQKSVLISSVCLCLVGLFVLPQIPRTSGNNFELTVYASEKEYKVESEITLPELKYEMFENGNWSVTSESGNDCFGVTGENIDTIVYTSEKAEFLSFPNGDHFQTYRFKYNPDTPEESYVRWLCYDSVMYLDEKNPDYTKIPKDTITIEVTFTNDEVVKKAYEISFNKKGEMVIKKLSDNTEIKMDNEYTLMFRTYGADNRSYSMDTFGYGDEWNLEDSRIRAYDIHQENGEIRYDFKFDNRRELGITGNNINTVTFTSENNQLYDDATEKNVSEITVNYNAEFLNECFIPWTLPDMDEWVKEVNEKNSYDFTTIPKDTVTIKITFNNGSFTELDIDLSFNKKGHLLIDAFKDNNTVEGK